MVKVREEHPEKADGSVDLERWVRRLPVPESVNRGTLLRACGVTRAADERAQPDPEVAWGEDRSCLPTGLEMAEILADLHVDQDGLVAAILYRAVREGKLSTALVEDQFGAPIAKLIDGVLRMAAISRVKTERGPVLGQVEDQSDTVRKMLVALVDDVRVALIKLAERTCAIRAVKNSPEKRYRVAREVADIYAPLAHRLGIGHIKWELEDLSFRYLQPDSYKKIAKLLDEKRLDRQGYIDQVIGELRTELEQAGIKAEFSGRAKHIYSIWRKMQRKGIGFSQVYDIRAVRVLVPEVKDCYAALGIVHGLWRNVPNEFDDYIANPKDNGYRSLHTAVIGPAGKVLEVQIRSFDMHEEAEFGVCAHWRYKGADKQHKTVNSYEEKIAWLRQVLEWHEETGAVSDLTEQFSRAQDRVYVFTPEGHVINLEHGSTPLDFAYHIHTEVGHRCRGAKVNGRIVPLTYVLQTGEQVEILTGKDNSPRRDWLQANLGYLKGGRARAKVQTWFRQQAREDNIAAGRSLLEKEFKRLALTSLDYKAVAERVRSATVEDMYAAVGVGSLSATQVLHAAQALLVGDEQVETTLPPQLLRKRTSKDQAGAIHIRGVGNLLTHIAGCCKPVPGDAIIGYITVGRGVSVHRQDCAKILQLQYAEPERIIEVSWGDEQATYPVELAIQAHDRQGLLRDITQLFATERINVLALNTLSDVANNTATMRLTIEITGLDALSGLLSKLNGLRNIISASRVREGETRGR
jgi:GTP pyrophosphokinase